MSKNNRLDNAVQLLNAVLAQHIGPVWTRKGNRNVSKVGAFVVDSAYGGYMIARIANEAGGESVPFGYERMSKADLERMVRAIVDGVRMEIGEKEFSRRIKGLYKE